jgi:uncharacterized membrane protein YtjA (UPF0391 family)
MHPAGHCRPLLPTGCLHGGALLHDGALLHSGALPTTPSSTARGGGSPSSWMRQMLLPWPGAPSPTACSTASLSDRISSRGGVRIRRVSLSLSPPPPVERRRGSGGCPPLSSLGAGGPCPAIQHPRRRGGGSARWRPSGVLGSVSPSRWWPVAGSDAMVASRRRAPPCVIFFFFLVLFLVRLNSGAQRRTFHAVSKGRHHLAFLCRAPPRGAWQRFLAVRFCGMRTANEFHRAKICRVPFVVRLDPSEFEKAQGVKSGTVGVLKPGTVVVSGGAPQLSANTTPNRSTC